MGRIRWKEISVRMVKNGTKRDVDRKPEAKRPRNRQAERLKDRETDRQ